MAIPRWLSLSDHAAIVTGSGSPSGIGLATAQALLDLGAKVVVTATGDHVHDRVRELGGADNGVWGVAADLGTMAGAQAVVDFAVSAVGAPAVLVNNAGMTSQGRIVESGSVVDIPEADWRDGLRRNLDSAFFMSRAAIPHMRALGFGRIVFVTSITGPVMAMRGEAAYAAAKAGMVGLMRSIAIDEAPHGITANAVAPGWIDTGAQTPEESNEGDYVPLARSGSPNEVAAIIASLCTPGSAYTTGQVIAVDGGNSVGEEREPRNGAGGS